MVTIHMVMNNAYLRVKKLRTHNKFKLPGMSDDSDNKKLFDRNSCINE